MDAGCRLRRWSGSWAGPDGGAVETQSGLTERAREREGQLHPRLAAVVGMVPSLAVTIGGACEVVVHDLSKVPN